MSKDRSGSMVDYIRDRIESSSNNMRVFLRIKDGAKRRVRFLTEFSEATRIVYHDKWGEVNTPCLRYFGKKCKYCNNDKYRTRDQFAWSVYDYESKEVFIMIYPANDSTPVSDLLAMFDEYGTILDRDYVISRRGKGFDTKYSVVPLEKSVFRGKKRFFAFSEEEVFEKLKEKHENDAKRAAAAKAKEKLDEEDFDDDDDDDEEEETPKRSKKSSKKKASASKKKSKKYEDVFDDEDDEDDEEPPFDDDEDDDDEDFDDEIDDDDDEDDLDDEDDEEEEQSKKRKRGR